MDIDEIARRLETLGLDEDDAEIYLHLLHVGPAKVSAIAPHVDASRTSVYRGLDRLCDHGFASKSLDRPTIYAAEKPQALFDRRVRELEVQREKLEQLNDELAGPLAKLQAHGVDESETHWKRLGGAEQIYKTIQSIAGGAEESICLASNDAITFEFDAPSVADAWRAGVARVKDGVPIRLLLELPDGSEVTDGLIPDWVPLEEAEARTFSADRGIHFMIVDDRDVVVWAQPARDSSSPEDAIAIWTDAPGVLAPLSTLFEKLWADGAEIEAPASGIEA